MPAKRSLPAAVTSAETENDKSQKKQITSIHFPPTGEIMAGNSPSPSTSIARFFDGQLRAMKLSRVRGGRFKMAFGGLESAVTTAVLLEHDFHVKKEVRCP
jgi:hypothetical protein